MLDDILEDPMSYEVSSTGNPYIGYPKVVDLVHLTGRDFVVKRRAA